MCKVINACSVADHEGYALLASMPLPNSPSMHTQAAAKELAVHGITVNAYCLGVVGTGHELDRGPS